MPQPQCNGVLNTTTNLWIIGVNEDGTYLWGNAENAVCFTEQMQSDIVQELGQGFVGQNPKDIR